MKWLAAIVLLACVLRFPKLAERPMHADEAIHADRLGILLDTGSAHYDPAEYHGPALARLSVPAAWMSGARSYQQLSEIVLRAVPAAFGVLLVVFSFALGSLVSREAGWLAALFTAVARGMIFYSRDYIPEMLLACFSVGLLLAVVRYAEKGSVYWAAVAGGFAGLMFATKETTVLVLAAAAAALVVLRPRVSWKAVAVAALSAALVALLFFGPMGVAALVRSFGIYAGRGLAAGGHAKPWYAYFEVLWRSGDGIFVLLALTALRGRDRMTSFLLVYSTVLTILYSAIPYKTPWCVVGFLHGWILVAAIGVSRLAPVWRMASAGVALAALLAGSMRPYAYVETLPDVYAIRDAIAGLAKNHADGNGVPIQVFTTENLWPLPWYLRQYPNVRWWRSVPDSTPRAPVMLVSPAMEAAVTRLIYELPPPGQRELYVPLFERAMWLREGVEVRGYAAYSLAAR